MGLGSLSTPRNPLGTVPGGGSKVQVQSPSEWDGAGHASLGLLRAGRGFTQQRMLRLEMM